MHDLYGIILNTDQIIQLRYQSAEFQLAEKPQITRIN